MVRRNQRFGWQAPVHELSPNIVTERRLKGAFPRSNGSPARTRLHGSRLNAQVGTPARPESWARSMSGVPTMPPARRRSVTDIALRSAAIEAAEEAPSRAKVLQRLRLGDAIFRSLTLSAAITVLVLLSGVIFSLVVGSLPAFRTYGLSFVT